MSEADRLAVCAELLELVQQRSQPELAQWLGTSQTSISKALRRGDVGPGIADDLAAKLGTSREALKKKHAAVVSGRAEKPWETWLRMDRPPGNRTDLWASGPLPRTPEERQPEAPGNRPTLLDFAERLGIQPGPPVFTSEEQLEGARHLMRAWGVPAAAIAAAEANTIAVHSNMDAYAIAKMWQSWIHRPPSVQEQSEEEAGSPSRVPRPTTRKAKR